MGGPGGFPRGERSSGLSQLLGGASFLSLQAAGTLQRRAGLCRPAPTTRQTSWKEKGRKEKKNKGRKDRKRRKGKERNERERKGKERRKKKGKKKENTHFFYTSPRSFIPNISPAAQGRGDAPPPSHLCPMLPAGLRARLQPGPPRPPPHPGPPSPGRCSSLRTEGCSGGRFKGGCAISPLFPYYYYFLPPPIALSPSSRCPPARPPPGAARSGVLRSPGCTFRSAQ